MSRIATLRLGLTGPNPVDLFKSLVERGLAGSGTPESLWIDGRKRKPTPDWFDLWMKKYKRDISIDFGENFVALNLDIVKIAVEQFEIKPRDILTLLTELDFELASFFGFSDEWYNGKLGEDYQAPSFGDLHWPHGWACAFQGNGHNRLVSRRWLDFGPWRLLHGDKDTTLVQFHDLEVGAAMALAQAMPGHERMGISDTGGFLQIPYFYTHDLKGLYIPDERKLKIVIHGRDVSQGEMLDASAVRHFQRLGPEQPIDNVVYVFMEEGAARIHLHELWLRELECWAIIDGREVRLDEDYHPTPEKPDWVRRVEEREGHP